jgi:UDP-glucose 4-epimerase
MHTYLVTGAAGFIGSKLAEFLVSKGNKVVTIDNLSTGFISNIPAGVIFITGNCQDIETIRKLDEYQFDAVFHIAGQSSGEVSFEDPVYDLQTNAQSTLLLLKYCLQSGCKKFIYASTMSVYGDQDELPVNELAYPQPKSLYGVGKLASEQYLRIYAQFGIATSAIRLFNVYGPGQNLENMKQGMVSIFMAQALENGHIHVKGAPDRFRDFIYIDDVVNAFVAVKNHIEVGTYTCFNVCSSVKTTVGNIIEKLNELFEGKLTAVFEGSTPGDQFGIYGTYDCLHDATGWTPETGLDVGLANMYGWCKNLNT